MMKNIDVNKPINANGKLKQICPIIIKTAPNKVAPLVPVILSAIHPPVLMSYRLMNHKLT